MMNPVAMLAPADLTRLTKICGLFGSDHVGERAAAAARADQIVRASGLTWPTLLGEQRLVIETPGAARRDSPTPGEILARHGDRLTGWERRFLATLVRQRNWSARQAEVFQEICSKVGAAR